jgi:hypothetical protein
MSGMIFETRFRLRAAEHNELIASNSCDGHSFCAACLARDDSSSRNWHIQTVGPMGRGPAPQGAKLRRSETGVFVAVRKSDVE